MKSTSIKFLFSMTFVVFAIALLTGCSHRPDTINRYTIVRQANRQLEQKVMDQNILTIRVGKYEANDSERAILRKLAAAGLVTYKVTRYAWWEKIKKEEKKAVTVTKYLYFLSYQDTEYRTVKTENYEFCDHYVVDVALTKEGQKLLTDRLEAEIVEDKDLVQPEVDPSQYIWNQKDLSENWPEIENPFIEKKNVIDDSSSSRKNVASEKEGTADKQIAKSDVTRIDSLQYLAFSQFSTDCVALHLLAYNAHVTKARNIQIYEENGFPKCKAEIVLEAKNVSDVGRIYYGVENRMKTLRTVELEYFIDKGWILSLDDDEPIPFSGYYE